MNEHLPDKGSTLKFVRQLRAFPGMYLLQESYTAASMLVAGFDIGLEGAGLVGLREWLIPRVNGQENLTWPHLMLGYLEQRAPEQRSPRRRMVQMFDALIEFLEERESRGLKAIVNEHRQWLKRVHDGSSRSHGRRSGR